MTTAEEDVDSLPFWVIPPPEGFEAEDLDHLPGLPNHSELIDGSLVFFAPQTVIHCRALMLFHSALERTVPDDLLVCSRMTVILDEDQRPNQTSSLSAPRLTEVWTRPFTSHKTSSWRSKSSPKTPGPATGSASRSSTPKPGSRISGGSRPKPAKRSSMSTSSTPPLVPTPSPASTETGCDFRFRSTWTSTSPNSTAYERLGWHGEPPYQPRKSAQALRSCAPTRSAAIATAASRAAVVSSTVNVRSAARNRIE